MPADKSTQQLKLIFSALNGRNKPKEQTRTSEQGFTLVEIMVVSMLLAIMSVILYSTLNGLIRGRNMVEGRRDTTRVAQYVLERISRELSSHQDDSNPVALHNSLGPLESVKGSNSEGPAGGIRFVSVNSAQISSNNLPNLGLVDIEYRLEKKKNNELSSSDEEGMLLIRDEMPGGVPPNAKYDDFIKNRRVLSPIAENVISLGFRFLSGGKWRNEWKGSSALPEAVEISLAIRGAEKRTEIHRTAVWLKHSTANFPLPF